MARVCRWVITCQLVLVLALVDGQNIPTFPQMIKQVAYHARYRADMTEAFADVLTTMKGFDLSQILYRNESLTVRTLTESVCSEHMSVLIESISEGQTWAMKFGDAAGKLPSGLLEGDLLWYGGFSECRGIKVPSVHANSTVPMYRGQYCLAYIANKSTETSSVMAAVIQLGVCLPNSCNETDTGSLLNAALSLLPGDFLVHKVDCKPNDKPPFSTGAIFVIFILSVICALVVLGTCCEVFLHQKHLWRSLTLPSDGSSLASRTGEDLTEHSPLLIHPGLHQQITTVEPKPGIAVQMLLCFSIVANMKKILTVDQKRPDTLTAVHGIRFISMSWVILGHALVFMLTMIRNPLVIWDDYMKRFSFQAILNASVSVDTFFLLSGLLASYLLLKQIHKSDGPKNINWPLLYSHRYWRLTPVYMMIIGFYITLFHYLGSGPLYPETEDVLCKRHWWHNMLYINNLFNQSEECMDWMWYLANDMQFFVISPLIIVALYNWFVVGVVIIGALILMSIIVTWILTEKNHYFADTAAVHVDNAEKVMDWFTSVYVRPYCRVGVYAIGIGLGYILYRLPTRPRIRVLWVITGWLLAAFCCLSVLYGLYGVASGEKVLTSGVTAFYASFHRIGWALGVSWVIFACYTGYGGPVNTILSWPGFVPLSRLTYVAYLIHPIIITWYYSTMELPIHISDTTIVSLFVTHLVLAYAGAFVLSVTMESPLIALEKLLLPQKNR